MCGELLESTVFGQGGLGAPGRRRQARTSRVVFRTTEPERTDLVRFFCDPT